MENPRERELIVCERTAAAAFRKDLSGSVLEVGDAYRE